MSLHLGALSSPKRFLAKALAEKPRGVEGEDFGTLGKGFPSRSPVANRVRGAGRAAEDSVSEVARHRRS